MRELVLELWDYETPLNPVSSNEIRDYIDYISTRAPARGEFSSVFNPIRSISSGLKLRPKGAYRKLLADFCSVLDKTEAAISSLEGARPLHYPVQNQEQVVMTEEVWNSLVTGTDRVIEMSPVILYRVWDEQSAFEHHFPKH